MKISKYFILGFSSLIGLLPASFVLAADEPGNPFSRLSRTALEANLPYTSASPETIVIRIIVYALGFVGLFFLINIIYAGYQIMTSTSSDKVDVAKNRIKNAVIGLVIIVCAYIITAYIANIAQRTTNNGYYDISGKPPGNPSGDCSTNADCEKDFGARWECQNGSCVIK